MVRSFVEQIFNKPTQVFKTITLENIDVALVCWELLQRCFTRLKKNNQSENILNHKCIDDENDGAITSAVSLQTAEIPASEVHNRHVG